MKARSAMLRAIFCAGKCVRSSVRRSRSWCISSPPRHAWRFPGRSDQPPASWLQGHWSGEVVHTKKDGTKVVVASYWSLERDKNGDNDDIDSSLIVNYDLTERRNLQKVLLDREETLRVSEERLAAIIQSAMDAIITLVTARCEMCHRCLRLDHSKVRIRDSEGNKARSSSA